MSKKPSQTLNPDPVRVPRSVMEFAKKVFRDVPSLSKENPHPKKEPRNRAANNVHRNNGHDRDDISSIQRN